MGVYNAVRTKTNQWTNLLGKKLLRNQLTGFDQAFQMLYTGDFEMRDNQAFGQCYADHQDQISGLTANTSTVIIVSHHMY